jgi:predicted nucleic acid-binding protein
MRVVLDTNILCSALVTPGAPAARLYLAWRDGTFTLVSSGGQIVTASRMLEQLGGKRQRAKRAKGRGDRSSDEWVG